MIRKNRQERGAVEVEATFIFPMMILSIIFLLYLSLIMFQRANLQATLETALLYYKNTLTDTYVIRNDEMQYTMSEGSYIGKANSYSANEPLNPYRWIEGENKSESDFETYFMSVVKNMFFDDNISIYFDYKNNFILKEIVVTVEQAVEIPINLDILGIDNNYVISATARMVAVDHDDTIRNIDYVIDIVEDTAVGEFFETIKATVTDYYGRFKDALGV